MKKFSMKLLYTSILLVYLLFMGYVAYNHTQVERFGDETAQMIGGHYLLEGKRLYRDLQFNHQPLNYVFSAITEKLTHPQTLYFYVARQREAVFIYGAIWNIVYYLAFGPVSIIFTLVFEYIKYFYQGYKLLGETLAVYPLIFLFGITLESFVYKKIPSELKLIVFSIGSFIALFSLLPLMIVIAPLTLLMVISTRKSKRKWLYIIIPFITLVLLTMFFYSYSDLIRETIIYNFKYFLPNSGGKISLWKMFILPFMSWIPPYNPSKILVGSFVLFTIISIFQTLKEKRHTGYLLFILMIIACNFFRVDEFGFANFHLLPWVGALFMTEFIWLKYNGQKSKMIIIVLLLSISFIATQKQFIAKKNQIIEYYNNYSESESYGKALQILLKKEDRLLVIPNDPLIYWVSNSSLPTHVLEYYPWVYFIPEYKKELLDLFISHPPEFIVDTGLDKTIKIENDIHDLLQAKYIRIFHTGTPSKLYILKSRISSISDSQRNSLNSMLYTQL